MHAAAARWRIKFVNALRLPNGGLKISLLDNARRWFNPTFKEMQISFATGAKRTMDTAKFIGAEFAVATAVFVLFWGVYAIAATF